MMVNITAVLAWQSSQQAKERVLLRQVVSVTAHLKGKHTYRWYTAPPALLAAARAARPDRQLSAAGEDGESCVYRLANVPANLASLAADHVSGAAAALSDAGASVQPVPGAFRDGAIAAADAAASGGGGRSVAVTVRGPGGAGVVPAAVQLVSDVAERRLQRLLEKLRLEGFALGMRLTAWFQARSRGRRVRL